MGEREEELYIQRAPVRAELIRQPEPGTWQVRREDHGDFCFCAPPAFGPEGGDRADSGSRMEDSRARARGCAVDPCCRRAWSAQLGRADQRRELG
jgi:hypothetical protein